MNPQTDLNAILNFKRWKPWKTHHNEVRQVALDSNHQLPINHTNFSQEAFLQPPSICHTGHDTSCYHARNDHCLRGGMARRLPRPGNDGQRGQPEGGAGKRRGAAAWRGWQHLQFFWKKWGNMEGLPIRGISWVSFWYNLHDRAIYRLCEFGK